MRAERYAEATARIAADRRHNLLIGFWTTGYGRGLTKPQILDALERWTGTRDLQSLDTQTLQTVLNNLNDL